MRKSFFSFFLPENTYLVKTTVFKTLLLIFISDGLLFDEFTIVPCKVTTKTEHKSLLFTTDHEF